MARLTGALFSLAASGTIADTLTFAKWKGIQYVRTRVIPANPQSTAQTEVRNSFTTLNEMWKRMGAIARASYIAAVRGQPLTARNRHIQANLVTFRDGGEMLDYIFSVQSGQALPPSAWAPVDGGGKINMIGMTCPTAPTGYTFSRRLAACLIHGDPNDSLTPTVYEGASVAAAGNFTIDSVPAGAYCVGAWIEWERDADERLFYGAPIRCDVINVT